METTINEETTSQQAGPALQLKRSLLPIDEYSAREGLSREIIEECGKLGIVQIRKYKGKTFVVDVPISPYHYCSLAGRETAEPPDRPAHSGKATEAVRIMPVRPSKAADGPTEATDEITRTESPQDIVRTPDLEALEITAESPQLIGELTETEGTSESATSLQNDSLRFDIPAEQAGSKRTWQIVAVFFLMSFSAAVFVNLWLYVDWKGQTKTLKQAYTTIQKIHSGFTKATLRIEILKNERDNSAAELERLRNELDRSAAEVKNLRDELGRARRNLEAIKHRNFNTVERLNEQIKDFTARLEELTKSNTVLSGTDP